MSTALLVVNVHESFAQQPRSRDVSNPDLVGNVSRLADAARSRNELVVWVLHIEPGTDFVTDATATFPLPHPTASRDRDWEELRADPRTLSTEVVVERTEYALAAGFASIRRTSDLVAA